MHLHDVPHQGFCEAVLEIFSIAHDQVDLGGIQLVAAHEWRDLLEVVDVDWNLWAQMNIRRS